MLSIIPLNPAPNQKFQTKVPIDGCNKTLGFEVWYNDIAGYWTMNIKNEQGEYLLSSIPLVPGADEAVNILGQYEYLSIGSAYLIPAQTVKEEWPDDVTLGVNWYLVWGDTANA